MAIATVTGEKAGVPELKSYRAKDPSLVSPLYYWRRQSILQQAFLMAMKLLQATTAETMQGQSARKHFLPPCLGTLCLWHKMSSFSPYCQLLQRIRAEDESQRADYSLDLSNLLSSCDSNKYDCSAFGASDYHHVL